MDLWNGFVKMKVSKKGFFTSKSNFHKRKQTGDREKPFDPLGGTCENDMNEVRLEVLNIQ